ncbi:4-amino-4-deoxy-L-arabinose-phosphoundecaprenol flippase subunit ArnE [Candidatus Brocadiaceae bacterium B188]|jgi:drug/metabolite transporter (DMT)-like permease|nr:EamA family transporter [Candidatus Brocadia sapporoensis]MEB2309866.1 EamA family transporter [Candidatus Brocadiaceae bacterium]OQZ01201.1 MAG: hypothetical protein B6D34_13980 [Candidatus Brocadia sp. UTAMX1]QQR66152.1 MAG: EamA family transporter [Candidatus Brocadia sp.]RZV56538.1 MAG: hypothetical protein EX330_13020 [Candidatus Brocadia sp. BROELEC01]TWU53082.1 4-amino-4-deoxy-L-arabinose-phosphoundecaprenol flippase subunit ArnE [Candidatus Brocadiaceae bacterium B188]
MRTILSFAVVVLAGAAGEIAIAHAMKQIGEVHSFSLRVLTGVLRRAIRMVWLWIGVVLIALGFFSMLALLSWENVSFVVPSTALSYAVGALGAKFLLGEKINGIRWAGVLLVCIGVCLVWAG